MILLYKKIERLGGGGSDFAAFVQHIGIPSALLSYGSGTTVLFLLTLWFSTCLSKYMHNTHIQLRYITT